MVSRIAEYPKTAAVFFIWPLMGNMMGLRKLCWKISTLNSKGLGVHSNFFLTPSLSEKGVHSQIEKQTATKAFPGTKPLGMFWPLGRVSQVSNHSRFYVPCINPHAWLLPYTCMSFGGSPSSSKLYFKAALIKKKKKKFRERDFLALK